MTGLRYTVSSASDPLEITTHILRACTACWESGTGSRSAWRVNTFRVQARPSWNQGLGDPGYSSGGSI